MPYAAYMTSQKAICHQLEIVISAAVKLVSAATVVVFCAPSLSIGCMKGIVLLGVRPDLTKPISVGMQHTWNVLFGLTWQARLEEALV